MFAKNYALIDRFPTKYKIKKGHSYYSKNYSVSFSKENTPVFSQINNEKTISLCSRYYPKKNSEKEISQIKISNDIVIVLGLLCGYQVLELSLKYPDKKIFVIEPDKVLFNLFLQYFDLSFISNVKFFIGWDDYELIEKLNINTQNFDIFENKHFSADIENYFTSVKKRLNKKPQYGFSEVWKYKKFTGDVPKIIYIDSSYVLTKECILSFQKLNIPFRYVHIDQNSYNYNSFIKNILNVISEFKPDFIMTVNHLGFDKEGRFTEMLNELELPYVSWFVDSPNVILNSFTRNISDFANLFVWDKDYVRDLLNVGYKNVDYLPLATSTDIFFPKNNNKFIDVSFVGSSMFYAINKNLKSFIHRNDLLNLYEITANHFLTNNFRYVSQSIDILRDKYKYNFDSIDQQRDFEAAVMWRATQIYRLSGIQKLAQFNPNIYGDSNWEFLLDNRFNLNPELSYYDNLSDMYNASKINFNMTSRQMKNSVNQRVFDIPAVGGFLITDYKSQLEEIYDLKNDIVCFSDIEEIPSLIKYYLKNEKEREIKAQNAYKKVINSQTYENRIKKLLEIMTGRYKNL